MLTNIDIAPGRQGTKETLKIMRSMVTEYRKCPFVRNLTLKIIRQDSMKNHPPLKLRAIWRWVRRNVDYVADVVGVEYIQAPRRLIESGAGDCDDMTVLIASMAESVGIATRLKAVKLQGRDAFSHVYPVIRYGQYEIAADATVDKSMGWQPTNTIDSIYY